MTERPYIEWHYEGPVDLSAGTGATGVEKAMPALTGALLAAWLWFDVHCGASDWGVVQWVIGIFVAIDVGGGAVANALNSCKRFYHTPTRGDERGVTRFAKNRLVFTSLHVHTIVVGALLAPSGLGLGVAWYIALCASTLLVSLVPLYLRRPVATFFLGGSVVVATSVAPLAEHFGWLPPLLFLKIVLGHAVREEPYRPARPKSGATQAS